MFALNSIWLLLLTLRIYVDHYVENVIVIVTNLFARQIESETS